MPAKPQAFANHARLDPSFHFFVAPVAAASAIVTIVHAVRAPSWTTAWYVVVAVAALVAVFKIRIYALRVQDRIIRLEERLRMLALLPEPLRPRVDELQAAQYIGLRFASDAELPALVERALDQKLSRKDIKRAVSNWRPDYSRI